MKTKNLFSALLIAGIALAASPASASSYTYYLDQSNTLPDGTDYASVLVDDAGGNLNFTVTALSPTNWKFSNFYFNLGGTVGTVSLLGLPTGWVSDTDQNVSAFGVFSDGEKKQGPGGSLQSSFSFVADSNVSLSLTNLVPNADGWIFAAHMQCQGTSCSEVDGNSSHFIAGPGELNPVPIPAAAWLFGSALLGFVSLSNRRKV